MHTSPMKVKLLARAMGRPVTTQGQGWNTFAAHPCSAARLVCAASREQGPSPQGPASFRPPCVAASTCWTAPARPPAHEHPARPPINVHSHLATHPPTHPPSSSTSSTAIIALGIRPAKQLHMAHSTYSCRRRSPLMWKPRRPASSRPAAPAVAPRPASGLQGGTRQPVAAGGLERGRWQVPTADCCPGPLACKGKQSSARRQAGLEGSSRHQLLTAASAARHRGHTFCTASQLHKPAMCTHKLQ